MANVYQGGQALNQLEGPRAVNIFLDRPVFFDRPLWSQMLHFNSELDSPLSKTRGDASSS